MTRYHLTAVVWQEEGQYVSQCPEIGVASCGDDAASAVAALKEAVELYLENARRLGILGDLKAALKSPIRFTTALEVAV